MYRHHVCTIAGIRENYYEGNDYFKLKTLFGNPLKLFIATHKAKPPALRRPTTHKEDERRITAVDKKYFEMTEDLLCDELSVSLDISHDEVKDFLIERVKKTESQKQK